MIGDLPFGTYQRSDEQAIESAVRYMKEASCDAVKLEMAGLTSGPVDKRESIARVRAIVAAGIPVMGHVGLTPQTPRRWAATAPRAEPRARRSRSRTMPSHFRRPAALRSCSRPCPGRHRDDRPASRRARDRDRRRPGG